MELISPPQVIPDAEIVDIIHALSSVQPPENIAKWDSILDIEDAVEKQSNMITFAQLVDSTELKTCLLRACLRDDLMATKFFLERPVPIDGDLVKQVSETSNIALLKLLLDNGWDINEPISGLVPPALHYFVHNLEHVKWFLEQGADPSRRCRLRNLTPLSIAVQEAPIAVIAMMLDFTNDTTTGELLHHAARRVGQDDMTVIALLVKKGADMNRIMCQGDISYDYQHCLGLGTALHDAAEAGQTRAAQALLDFGADPTIPTP